MPYSIAMRDKSFLLTEHQAAASVSENTTGGFKDGISVALSLCRVCAFFPEMLWASILRGVSQNKHINLSLRMSLLQASV